MLSLIFFSPGAPQSTIHDCKQAEPPPASVSFEGGTFAITNFMWLEPGVHKFSQSPGRTSKFLASEE